MKKSYVPLNKINDYEDLRINLFSTVNEFLKLSDSRKYDCEYRSSLVSNLEVTHRTNFKTNITKHFWTRMRNYLKVKGIINQRQQKKILKELFLENNTRNLPDLKKDNLIAENKNLNFKKIKCNYGKFTNFLFRLNKFFSIKNQKFCFTLVPIFKFGRKNLQYSKDAIHQLCRKVFSKSVSSSRLVIETKAHQKEIVEMWLRCFNLGKIAKPNLLKKFLFKYYFYRLSVSKHSIFKKKK